MPGLFAMGGPATVAVVVAALLVVLVIALPSGRGAVVALVRQAALWPGLIRAELRGAAPLRVDGAEPGRPSMGDTTPDIPAITRGLPVVDRPDRA